MPGAMPSLNDAESKFFESRGEELAPSLSEALPERAEPAEPGGDASAGAGNALVEAPAPEKDTRQERLVPLQALQQERAEKKQLRDELRASREWQAQLAQRLQQFPITAPPHQSAQPPAPQAPDPQTKPLEYINHVLGTMQASTAELQQWRQQQEQAAQQRSAMQHYADWATNQEREFAGREPEYPDAYRYAADARDRELQSLGYSDPAQRAAIVRQNTAEIIHNALQQGRNPAELVWDYAQARGFTPKAKRSPGSDEAHAKIAAGLQAAGAKLNQGGATGEGELSTKDLAGITDPEEFEKAWKRVFGKKR